MIKEVRRDIQHNLKKAIIYLNQGDYFRLEELSNHTIHNASIFQDEDSISIAVVMYALSKIIKREKKIPPSVIQKIKEIKDLLTTKKMKEYSQSMRDLTKLIESLDSQMNLYIQTVLNNAEIKKGSRIYEHGISLSRAAHMLGINQWELMQYVGKTGIIDKEKVFSTDVVKKIIMTRKVFNSKNKFLVFDTGPIISLTMNHLMWTLDPLQKLFNGTFLISPSVKRELIDTPLETRKFKFEALHTNRYLKKKTITVYEDPNYLKISKELMDLCNNTYFAHGNPIKIVHDGEIDAIAIAIKTRANCIVVDERTTRLLIEDLGSIKKLLGGKLHTQITEKTSNLKLLTKYLSKLKVIRSIELATFAYEKGLLDRYLPDRPYNRVTLLDAVLWGLKLNGCAVSENEIMEIIAYENNF